MKEYICTIKDCKEGRKVGCEFTKRKKWAIKSQRYYDCKYRASYVKRKLEEVEK